MKGNTVTVSFRLSPKEKESLEEKAKEEYVPMSVIIKKAIAKKMEEYQ